MIVILLQMIASAIQCAAENRADERAFHRHHQHRRNDDGGDEISIWEAFTHGIILDRTFILRDLI